MSSTTAAPEARPAKKAGFTHQLYTGELSYPFIAHRRFWYTVTLVIIAVSLIGLLTRGLNLGIDFKGGVEFRTSVAATHATTDDVRKAVISSDLPDLDGTEVVRLGTDSVRVQTRALSSAEVATLQNDIAKVAGTKADAVTYSKVGSQWGSQITNKAVQALVVFLVLVMLLIWAYFREWKMSVAAILALAHDLIVTIGVYALVGFTVTPSTLIGVLTILGYSLYDTVVVFDKVRENTHDIVKRDLTYDEAANLAINQVLVRSINTTVIGVLPVAALLFAGAFVLGSGPLEDLGLALFVGMIAGAYSSIFIATPFLAQLRSREPAIKEHDARVRRRREKSSRAAAQVEARTVEVAPTSLVDAPSDSTRADGTASSRQVRTGASSRPQPRKTTRSQRKK
ncbi:protein translocase subunit SecF [Acidipropionibacterium timonense]|uniref:protein translocase subunit SecF n=1 Tax=Acidipropionibacterium timonense TaxID=2161818 RepID=UPI001031BF83|nr:protein translocase subunit SecF [Acidipropionibacterium timonense]